MYEHRRILVVAAHPDDEALGCGGTMARLASEGAEIHTLFLSDGVNARAQVADAALDQRRSMGNRAAEILGARPPTYLDFPDNRMDSVDLLDVVAAIERHAERIQPDGVLTHFASDLNVDHQVCAKAAMTAFRPLPSQSVRAIYAFEVASSTEWAFSAAGANFSPNVFFDISACLVAKTDALRAYGDEMRAFPHARSIEAIEALARWRGATIGVEAAEAFCLVRARV